VILVGDRRLGEASPAAAGMLAPSVERASGPAHDFAIAARDLFPEYLELLETETGVAVSLNRRGVLQVAVTESGVKGLRKAALPSTEWLDRNELTRLEPVLSHALGAVLNPNDGCVDNIAMLAALERLVASSDRVPRVEGWVTKVSRHGNDQRVLLGSGEALYAARVVLAPGAWGSSIDGAAWLRFVTPSRGQLVAYESIGLRHVAYGPRGYLVPRGGATIAGSTMESVGFDAATTPDGVAKVNSAAEEICPAISAARVSSAWAGLRPVTPDMLPLLGPDPANPGLLYACGHSRNGILLGPLTGEVIASLVAGEPAGHDLSQFRPDRF